MISHLREKSEPDTWADSWLPSAMPTARSRPGRWLRTGWPENRDRILEMPNIGKVWKNFNKPMCFLYIGIYFADLQVARLVCKGLGSGVPGCGVRV